MDLQASIPGSSHRLTSRCRRIKRILEEANADGGVRHEPLVADKISAIDHLSLGHLQADKANICFLPWCMLKSNASLPPFPGVLERALQSHALDHPAVFPRLRLPASQCPTSQNCNAHGKCTRVVTHLRLAWSSLTALLLPPISCSPCSSAHA